MIYDPELDRVTQYASEGHFNVQQAHQLLHRHSLKNRRHYMGLRTYVGKNFKRLVTPEEHPDLFLTDSGKMIYDSAESVTVRHPVSRIDSKEIASEQRTTSVTLKRE